MKSHSTYDITANFCDNLGKGAPNPLRVWCLFFRFYAIPGVCALQNSHQTLGYLLLFVPTYTQENPKPISKYFDIGGAPC
jgi:hypothetical protein